MKKLNSAFRNPPLYAKQQAFVQKFLESGALSSHACVGGWGSGKSTLAAVCTAIAACRNPHHAAYGPTQPRIMMLGPTQRIVEDVPCQMLDRIIPPELILRKWVRPWRAILVNGCEILARSAESEIEGIDVAGLWLTEIQHPSYWKDERFVPNIIARCRDPHSPFKRVLFDGLPGANVRHFLEVPEIELTQFASTDNPSMSPEVIAQLRRAIPAHLEASLIRGEWGQIEGSAFPQFDPSKAYFDDDGAGLKSDAPANLGVDCGNHSHMLLFRWSKVRDVDGEYTQMDVIDELPMLHKSLAEMAEVAKQKWRMPISTISHDPTMRYDETSALKRAWPSSSLKVWYKNDPLYYHESGNQLVRWALQDASGRVRIKFARHLERGGRGGIIDALLRSRTSPRTGEIVRDDTLDHAHDTLRYAACHVWGRVAPNEAPRGVETK